MKTYGSVAAGTLFSAPPRAHWRIECRPQVMLRLKRVFERISKASHGFALLHQTPENARDLLWFMERYPLEVSREDERSIRRLARADVARERAVDAIVSGEYMAPELDMALPPREYQAIAAALCVRTGGLLCADDLGLGKTVVGIATLIARGGLPALVVTQVHLQTQWQDQLAKFAPQLNTHILKRIVPYDLTEGPRGKKLPKPDVIITSYSKLSGWADELGGMARTLVLDEAQEVRHADSNGNPTAKYAAASYIAQHTPRRIGLTATPIFNYGGELFNVMEVLSPGSLGTREEFTREWCIGGGDKLAIKEPTAFAAYLRESGLMIRRTRKEVARELPGGAPQRVPHLIEANLDEINKIASSAAELARIILAQGRGFEKMQAAGELDWRLRQATGIAKAPYVAEFVKLLLESEPKVVLFGWHHEVYEIWREKLAAFNPVFYTGKESPKQKDEAKARFVEGDSRVMVMSLRSGAGLDGVQEVARTLVFGELDWSPAVHRQCEGRLFRDGQSDPVVGYYLMAESGSDPIIADVLGVKRQQIDGIMDPGCGDEPIATQIDPNHIAKLARSFLEQQGIALGTEVAA